MHWQSALIELEKLEKQSVSELTKRTVLKNMLPADLIRDLERDPQLKSFEKAWPFALEQIPLRKDWTSNTKKNQPSPMDLDAVEDGGSSAGATKGSSSPVSYTHLTLPTKRIV